MAQSVGKNCGKNWIMHNLCEKWWEKDPCEESY